MSADAPEFSRPLRLARIGIGPLHQQVTATEAECAALARRFDLVGLDRLTATVELTRQDGGCILLSAEFEADFAQRCIVTLDPVAGSLSERFVLLYGPPEAEAGAPSIAGDDDVTFEPLAGDAIDIGEAVAQEFSLALPPFPRSPGASVASEAAPLEDHPLAALSQFLNRPDDKPR